MQMLTIPMMPMSKIHHKDSNSKAVVVGKEHFLFGKGSSIQNGKDEILKAVLESCEMADEKVTALMLAMNDAGLHQLVHEFLLRNQAMILHREGWTTCNSTYFSSFQRIYCIYLLYACIYKSCLNILPKSWAVF
jgi:hypothetical protein